uniref:Uncharacterized protein n=1 Tax=Anguilla anguilla TaxID=7936 RepID=A0A0E9TYY7_ANGAN
MQCIWHHCTRVGEMVTIVYVVFFNPCY